MCGVEHGVKDRVIHSESNVWSRVEHGVKDRVIHSESNVWSGA